MCLEKNNLLQNFYSSIFNSTHNLDSITQNFPTHLCCYYRWDSHYRSVHATSRPHFCPNDTPSYAIAFAMRGIGDQLTPVHLNRRNPRTVRCYALIIGWLLLSLPPVCFWISTNFLT